MFELRPIKRNHNSVASYNPFRDMENFEREFFNNGFWNNDSLMGFKTDIQDKGDSYLLEADLPGFNKEDINIDIDDDYMTISAERHSEHEDKDRNGNYVRCERSYGSYSRSFDISGVKADQIAAKYENGVLKLTMPKKDEGNAQSTRRLEIE